jgi:hypothetical protein
LHLGGGATPGDSLSAFKESFGGEIFQYFTLGIIADGVRYDELVERRRLAGAAPPASYFFPAYRA